MVLVAGSQVHLMVKTGELLPLRRMQWGGQECWLQLVSETSSSGKVVVKVTVPVSRIQEANGKQQGEGCSRGN